MAYGHAAEARRDAVLLEGENAVVYLLGRVPTLEVVGWDREDERGCGCCWPG